MSFARFLWRNMRALLLAASALSLILGACATGVIVDNSRRSGREKEMEDAVAYLRETLQSCAHQLRDLSNDSTFYHLYDNFVELEGNGKYANRLSELTNYLTRVTFTQDSFKYLLFQTEEFYTIQSSSFFNRTTKTALLYKSDPADESPAEVLRRALGEDKFARHRLISVYTNVGITLSGLIDLESIFDDTLSDFVVSDAKGNILYNGMKGRCSREAVGEFLRAGARTLAAGGRRWRANVRADGELRVAQFYEVRFELLTWRNAALMAGATLLAMLFSLVWLYLLRNRFHEYMGELKRCAAGEAPAALDQIAQKLLIGRRARTMRGWLCSVLVRVCIPPLVILVLLNCLLCIDLQKTQSERDARNRIERQVDMLDRRYQHCVSFLRNASIDHLLQNSISAHSPAADLTFMQEYSAILWNKCSERDLLLGIAIFDTEWNRVYLTGDAEIATDAAVRAHFAATFNQLYVRCDDKRTICYLGIRNAGMIQSSSAPCFAPFGYIAIAIGDPLNRLTAALADTEARVSILAPGEEGPAAAPGTQVVCKPLTALNRVARIEAAPDRNFGLAARTTAVLFAVLLLGLFCLLLLSADNISQHMLRALLRMQNNLEAIYRLPEGEAPPSETGIDEFDQLTAYFRQLMLSLKEKQDDLRKKELELLREQKMRVDLQLAAIESQLSPHFLFNIFTSIRFLLEENNIPDAKEMLKLTVRMFRSFLYRGHTLTTLEAELEHVSSYMQVQRFRFGERLDLRLPDLDTAARGAAIPQYTLQPLVENAIEHALPACPRLVVRVSVLRVGEEWEIAIADNGGALRDMDVARIEALLAERNDPYSHCGLFNIHKRLQLHFGCRCGLRFARNADNGLTVFVRIPCGRDTPTLKRGGDGKCLD